MNNAVRVRLEKMIVHIVLCTVMRALDVTSSARLPHLTNLSLKCVCAASSQGKQKSARSDATRQLASHVAAARVADVRLSVKPYVLCIYT